MRRRSLVEATVPVVAVVLLATMAGPSRAADEPAKPTADGLFGLTRIVKIDVELTPEEYRAMQPPAPAPGFGGGPPPAPRPRKPGERESETNLFGVSFPWVRGSVTVDGTTLRGVGVRYAGNAAYMAAANGLKRPLLVDLDRADPPATFRGLHGLVLQAGALDPSRMREVLAFKMLRAAGVVAPRTALAEVTLTVPGQHEKTSLGLYTLVEPVDRAFLRDRFGAEATLLVRPQGLRGLDVLGDDWAGYRGPYRPAGEPSADDARRLVAFLKLVAQADDAAFRKEIGAYLDVGQFLRFMAVHALTANADGFLTLAYNYAIALDPKTRRFVFIPLDQEMAFANFLMMGTPDQLMDMSLTRPYNGPNRLADRLLALPEVVEAQRAILKELTSTVFDKERLLADVETIDGATAPLYRRELAARADRGEPASALGPPGAPRPPDLRTFIDRRSRSIADQLAEGREGYRPRFNFAPPGGNAPPAAPLDDRTIGDVVKAPPGFKVTLFAAPPRVNYPVTLTAAPDGSVYVAVDEQGSLGRTPGGGRVVRCVDSDGDGKADRITVFARMDHPRGVVALEGKVWVMHPPSLSVYHDDDGDGVADRHETLVTGLTTRQIDDRGGDHTTNGIRMGVDGWLYIAVGDYGLANARGKDGTTLSQRGGGILRVRPDGTELEVVATGLRNPFAIAIDPYLSMFTRDNTNDGAGWDVRVSQIFPTADYGYTRTFARFAEETMPALGSYGQGGGTGALALHDDRWPAPYRGALLTADWGRSEVYRHDLTPVGASVRASQEVMVAMPRPTGMDVGPDGRLYVASWRGGEASVYVGPQVGFIACLTPPGFEPSKVIDPRGADLPGLVAGLSAADAATSLGCQRELLRRGRSGEATRALETLAADGTKRLHGRVAALFALKQLDGAGSHPTLSRLANEPALREFALRALADRKGERDRVDRRLFIEALGDASARVRAQGVIGLGRLGDVSVAPRLLPLTARPEGSPLPTARPLHVQPDPDRVVPHLAVRALVMLRAVDACLDALEGPHRDGALAALRLLHDPKAVEGLIKALATTRAPERRRDLLATLARLQQREAEYDGSWWGIRPDTAGPYYDPHDWECSARIAAVLKAAHDDGDAATKAFLREQFVRNRVHIEGLAGESVAGRSDAEEAIRVVVAKADPNNLDQVGNLAYEAAARRTLAAKGDPARGKTLFAAQSCRACHTDADGQTPKGPHLVDIGKRYRPEELVESILKPSAKIAQGYEAYAFALADGRVVAGFVVSEGPASVQVRDASGALLALKKADIEERRRQEPSIMPEGIVANLTPEQLADLVAYLRSLTP